MMNKISICLLALLISFAGYSQQAVETKAKFFGKEKRAVRIEVPYEPEIVEKALVDSMARLGIKASKVKGYTLFRNVPYHGEIADVYLDIERKSRKDNSSILTVFAVAPNSNPADAESDETKVTSSQTFLAGLIPAIGIAHQENNISIQEKDISADEKKLQNLVGDQQDLEKKIKSLQDKIQKNIKEQDALKKKLDGKRSMLQSMKGLLNKS